MTSSRGRRSRRESVVHCAMALLIFATAVDAAAQARPRRRTSPSVARVPGDSADALPAIRAGMRVRPETVTVGDPFTLLVTLEVPAGATVQWAAIADTAAAVGMRAPARVTSEVLGTTRRETAEYALTAWNVGTLLLGVPDAAVRTSADVRAVPLRDTRVVVLSVLPGDTSLRVPKPARGLFPRVVPWWELWWPAAAVVGALALLWLTWRRRRRRVATRIDVPLEVFARAMNDFERLQRMALADLGERGRAVALAVEILRTYLSARCVAAALSETSRELLTAMATDRRVPLDRLTSLLADADEIKFAHGEVSVVRARELHDEAVAIVQHVEQSDRDQRQLAEAARQAAERAQRGSERAAKRTAEDEARRRVRRAKSGAT